MIAKYTYQSTYSVIGNLRNKIPENELNIYCNHIYNLKKLLFVKYAGSLIILNIIHTVKQYNILIFTLQKSYHLFK